MAGAVAASFEGSTQHLFIEPLVGEGGQRGQIVNEDTNASNALTLIINDDTNASNALTLIINEDTNASNGLTLIINEDTNASNALTLIINEDTNASNALTLIYVYNNVCTLCCACLRTCMKCKHNSRANAFRLIKIYIRYNQISGMK